jgi:hypothetical protein
LKKGANGNGRTKIQPVGANSLMAGITQFLSDSREPR